MDQDGQATDVQESASGSENRDETEVAELTAWATEEMLSFRFKANIPDIVERGGLATVTDEYLKAIGIQLLLPRTKILDACKRKVMGCPKKTRFGRAQFYDPVLEKRPHGKNVWQTLAGMEKAHNKETYRAAFRTWRFCATGLDGSEDAELIQDTFQSWKEQPEEESLLTSIFNNLVEGLGTFLSSMPCCSR
eukprot:Skav204153  [mRNA]  locus=scaffold903:250283:250858:+ [translate_table: standard]